MIIHQINHFPDNGEVPTVTAEVCMPYFFVFPDIVGTGYLTKLQIKNIF